MKLKKVSEITAKDLLTLTMFINLPKGENLMDLLNKIMEMKITKYKYLYDIAEQNSNSEFILVDVEKDFDQMIFDAYDIYYNIKDILTNAHKEFPNIEGLTMMWNFLPLYETFLLTSKFNSAATKTIQKMFLQNLLKEEIDKENFEYCSELQSKIEIL